ncbi:hypothetical protein F5X98DRAFT_388941 [Xylaria grammica]|nr:hypothetical protein F5X98DRAFT_388941 [Xylaria grammica]
MSTTAGKKRLRGCETCRERQVLPSVPPCHQALDTPEVFAKNPMISGLDTSRQVIAAIPAAIVPTKADSVFGPSSGASAIVVAQGGGAPSSLAIFAHIIYSKDEPEFEFPVHQKWCRFASKKLAFIDETIETSANYGEESPGFNIGFIEPSSPIHTSSNQEHNEISASISSPLVQGLATDSLSGPNVGHATDDTGVILRSPSFPEQSDHTIPLLDGYTSSPDIGYHVWQRSSVPELGSQEDHGALDSHIHDSSFASGTDRPHLSCLGICESFSVQAPVFPLRHLNEAELMRYYINQIAPNFDFHDRELNFARGVPEAAGSRPMLMSLIAIVATKHQESFCHRLPLSNIDDQPRCAGCFQRALATNNHMLDGSVVATIVLQRFAAIIGTTLGKKGQECELTEIRTIFETQAEFLLPRGLHQAAFWAGVRQEIYLAVLRQRSTTLCLDNCNIDRSLENAEDEVWMGRITLHLVDVLEFCFGPTEMDAYAVQKYEGLVSYLADWAASKPESFEPLFAQLPEDGGTFPEIVFLSDCAMAAWHYYHLARMLLIAHNPRAPRVGSSYMVALRSIDNEIKRDVQILCGIAETPGNAYRACPAAIMGIMLAGDRFTDRREQQALFDFLVKVEKSHAWPTWAIQQEMKETWGWPPS